MEAANDGVLLEFTSPKTSAPHALRHAWGEKHSELPYYFWGFLAGRVYMPCQEVGKGEIKRLGT